MIEVRHFHSAELDAYLSIRREALATDPDAFSDSVEKFDARDPAVDKERFERHVTSEDYQLVGAFDGQRCVGMTGVIRNREPAFANRATIWGVFVSPEYRGQQLGQRMFDLLFQQATDCQWLAEVVLSVKTSNQPAIAMYERATMQKFEPAPDDPVFSSPCAKETHMRWQKSPSA